MAKIDKRLGNRYALAECGAGIATQLRGYLIFAFWAEAYGAFRPCWIVPEQLTMLLHSGTTAAALIAMTSTFAESKLPIILRTKAASSFARPEWTRKGTTALLRRRYKDIAIFCGENAHGRLIQMLAKDLFHTACEHSDPKPEVSAGSDMSTQPPA